MSPSSENEAWIERIAAMVDRLSQSGTEVTCRFDDLRVWIGAAGEGSGEPATWRLDGTLRLGAGPRRDA